MTDPRPPHGTGFAIAFAFGAGIVVGVVVF